MKKALLMLILLIALVDFPLSVSPMEIGKVVDKTYAPAPSGRIDYLLVVVQSGRQRSYFLSVPQDYFYNTRIGDRLPLAKRYGFVSGIEYSHALLIN